MSESVVCSDRTLACVQSAPTRRLRSSKTLFGTLLMLTGCWHLESSHFTVQRPVSYRILTSVWSALTGRVRSRKSFSGTSLELTGRRHLASGPLSLSVRLVPDNFIRSNELTRLTLQRSVTTRLASGQSFDPPFTSNLKFYVIEVCSN